MIERVIFVSLGEGVTVTVLRRFLLLSSVEWRERFEAPWEAALTERLAREKEAHEGLRVYLVAPANLHFAYELPPLDEEELGPAVDIKLKKDLLFPLRDFVRAFSREEAEGATLVQVAGVRRCELAPAMGAVTQAGLAVQRVYMRDQLVSAGVAAWSRKGPAPRAVVLADDGLLLVRPGATGQRCHRFPGGEAAPSARRLAAVARILGGAGRAREEAGAVTAPVLCDDELLSSLREAGVADLSPLSATPGAREAFFRLADHPSAIGKRQARAQLLEEEPAGFQPTRAHGMALLVAFFLLYQLWSLWAGRAALSAGRAAIAADSTRVSKAQAELVAIGRRAKALDKLEEAFAILRNEGYDSLGLLEGLSRLRPEGTRLERLACEGSRVRLRATAPSKQEVFAFVQALTAAGLVTAVDIKRMDFKEAGGVAFDLALTRNG